MFNFISKAIGQKLGVEDKFKRYLWNTLFTNGAKSFALIFIAIYIWKLEHNFALVLSYFLLVYVVSLFTYTCVAGYVTKKISPLTSLRLGILLSAVFYSSFLILGKSAVDYIWILAILHAFGTSLYITGDRTLQYDLSTSKGRQKNSSAWVMIRSIVQFIAPLIAGLIIVRSPELIVTKAYAPIFWISMTLWLLALINSFFFPKIKSVRDGYKFISKSKSFLKHRDMKIISISQFFAGISFGVGRIVFPLLIIMISLTEITVGGVESLKLFVSIILLYFVGRYLPIKRYAVFLVSLSILAFLIHLIPAISPSAVTIFIYAFLIALVYPPLDVIGTTIRNNILEKVCRKKSIVKESRIEYTVFLEFWSHLGILAGLGLLYYLVNYTSDIVLSLQIMVGVVGFSMMVWFAIKSLIKVKDWR